jgi:membrane-associated phospholipid phosphatase
VLLPQLFLLALAVGHPLPAMAQDALSALKEPTVLRWWHGAAFIGGLSVLMLLDQPTQRYVQGHRSGSFNEASRTIRRFGEIEVYGTVTAGMVAAGLLSGNSELTRTGGRLAATMALAGATSSFSKLVLGRPRPSYSLDADGYVPFSGQEAMPSGHTTMAFALATTLADEIDRTWASVGLYTLATGVGWSRINDDRHWFTDVAAGAALGITSAKLVSGRWRIFGLRPPNVLLGPTQAGIAWRVEF